jgi:hypothetical protein
VDKKEGNAMESDICFSVPVSLHIIKTIDGPGCNCKIDCKYDQADSASILTGTFPKSMVPLNIISYAGPVSALNATKPLDKPIRITVERVIIPFHFAFAKRIAITADNNININILINATDLKQYQGK